MLGQPEENNVGKYFASVKDPPGDSPEPEISDRMTHQLGSLGRTQMSQESGVGENSSVENTDHDLNTKAGQLQHGISRRLLFENAADFSFQPPSGNLGFAASPYMSSPTLFSDVFPERMESASKVSEESVGGSLDELARKSASNLRSNYAEFGECPQTIKPLLQPVKLNPEMLLQSKRKWNSETIDTFVPSTAKKKRKKTSESGENNGCKRCSCKKTKCLKLYCDCFAAGVYCAETCACRACFNKPEYEDTVLETRQQIESRNPLAFAPKIIKHINDTPSTTLMDAGDFTPLSGRHKRGCNCKKSKCLKKYCECYQANVGCSDACRCEGCENVHGRKPGYDMMKNVLSKQSISKKLESSFGLIPSEADFVQNQMYMAPYAPAFQDPVKSGSPWLYRDRFFQQPDLMTPQDSMRNESPWFNRLQPTESNLNLMDSAPFNAYSMSNQQNWMASWRTSTPFGTSKLSEDQMCNVVNYPPEDPQAMNGVNVSSPKKKRISPPLVPPQI